MNARYRPKATDNKQPAPQFVHTLNGSGDGGRPRAHRGAWRPTSRTDGSIAVPDVLQPYMGGLTPIEKA
jgi:seryl-tRNA synthetase